MTSREMYEYALIELNKLEAPSLLLEDYNYFINKAVQQYINLIYAKLEVDQQSTDDLRVLKTTAVLTPTPSNSENSADKLFGASYYVDLPNDYLHMINCIVEYKVNGRNFKCYDKDDLVYFAARRLTSDMYSQILNNAYLRPMYKRPYYFINNINTTKELPTNPPMDNEVKSSDHIDSQTEAYDRLANPSTVRMELRFGSDATIFTPQKLYIDYVKAPMYIRLTQDQIEQTLDQSQVLEFPDYVCFEIVNIFTRLVMENASDPRLQTNMPINNTITNPTLQQQAQQK